MKIKLIFLTSLFAYNYSNAQHWESFGTPNSSGTPLCMFVDSTENKLYVGGQFQYIDGQYIRQIAVWDGASWHGLGAGVEDYGNVWAITKFQGEIIVAGAFSMIGGLNANGIARWDGNSWHPFNGQPNHAVLDMFVYNNNLYICGAFDSLGTMRANGIGMWDGDNWHNVGNFPDYNPDPFEPNDIYAIQLYKGNLYLSGLFLDSTLLFTRHLAWFDGGNWHYFNEDLKGNLAGGWDLEVYNDELYVAGYFFTADGNYDNCI